MKDSGSENRILDYKGDLGLDCARALAIGHREARDGQLHNALGLDEHRVVSDARRRGQPGKRRLRLRRGGRLLRRRLRVGVRGGGGLATTREARHGGVGSPCPFAVH